MHNVPGPGWSTLTARGRLGRGQRCPSRQAGRLAGCAAAWPHLLCAVTSWLQLPPVLALATPLALQVLQADGGTRCACINAAFLALAAAAVPMRDVVAACAAGYLDSTPLLDLNYMEDSGGRGQGDCCLL